MTCFRIKFSSREHRSLAVNKTAAIWLNLESSSGNEGLDNRVITFEWSSYDAIALYWQGQLEGESNDL